MHVERTNLDSLVIVCDFNKGKINTDSLLKVQSERIFWNTVTSQSTVLFTQSPVLQWATLTTSWSI